MILLENIQMWQITHSYWIECAILTFSMRNNQILFMQKCINAKIAHFPAKICAIFRFNVQNRAARGPNPITGFIHKFHLNPTQEHLGEVVQALRPLMMKSHLQWDDIQCALSTNPYTTVTDSTQQLLGQLVLLFVTHSVSGNRLAADVLEKVMIILFMHNQSQ